MKVEEIEQTKSLVSNIYISAIGMQDGDPARDCAILRASEIEEKLMFDLRVLSKMEDMAPVYKKMLEITLAYLSLAEKKDICQDKIVYIDGKPYDLDRIRIEISQILGTDGL